MSVDMFLKITSAEGAVEGESTDKNHAGEIDILAWNWGLSQSGSTHLGKGGGSGKVSVQVEGAASSFPKSALARSGGLPSGTRLPFASAGEVFTSMVLPDPATKRSGWNRMAKPTCGPGGCRCTGPMLNAARTRRATGRCWRCTASACY